MPKNVSKPIWACTICWTRFDQNEDAAQRCESAGAPTVVADGAVLLDYDDGWRKSGFKLRSLFRVPGSIGTVASVFNSQRGHTVWYVRDLDPSGLPRYDDGGIRWPDGAQPQRTESKNVWPHRNGVVNFSTGTWSGTRAVPHVLRGGEPWILDLFGLTNPDATAKPDTHPWWARPLTPQVKAILDAFDVQVMPLHAAAGDRPSLSHFARYDHPVGALAHQPGRAGDPSQPVHKARIGYYLRSVPLQPMLDEINDMWRRWRAGEQITVPSPRFDGWSGGGRARKLTPSKITKRLRELVDAAGYEWRPRTNGIEYARSLVSDQLGYTMDTTSKLFAGKKIVAFRGVKGGVGKSHLAAATARRLAADGKHVVLVDCDLSGPSQHLLFCLGDVAVDERTMRILPQRTDQPRLQVFSPGQMFAPGQAISWASQVIEEWLTFVGTSLAVDDADVVVLDLPPGDSAVHRMLLSSGHVDIATHVHVTTGHPVAIADTRRGLPDTGEMHEERVADRRHVLVENLSQVTGTLPDGTATEVRLHGQDGDVARVAVDHGTIYGGSIPWQPNPADLAATSEIDALTFLIDRRDQERLPA